MAKAIYPFNTPDPVTIEQAGGKALSLIAMTRAGFPVPPGFVLTVSFFESWQAEIQSHPAWQAVRADPTDTQAIRELKAAGDHLPFSEQQKAELDEAVHALMSVIDRPGQVNLFAVRSSSPEEDLDNASFAGGYETSLGVTVQGLEDAIRRCFSSSFDERVFVYKREHGFATDQQLIAVIVQQQIAAESAGVAFSLNPLNNCYDEVLINASHGLGEAVVSGSVEPDQFVVDRLAQKIIESKIGESGTIARLDTHGGVTHSPRSTEPGASLSPEQVLRVARLSSEVEAAYGKPIDIEWAIANDQLYLLQARPITAYLPLPPEMITPPGAPKRLYANSTLIEQGLTEPLSVLGTDFLNYVLVNVGGPVGSDGIGPGGITFTASGGYYMNISYALKLGMNRAALAPGSFGDPRVMAILNSIDMQEYTAGELPQKLKGLRSRMLINMLPMAKSVLGAVLKPGRILRNYQAALPAAVDRLNSFSGEGRALKSQAIELTGLLQFFYGDYGIPMILAGQIAQQRIKSLFKQETGPVQDHLINLGISLPGNKTTEMGQLMYSLASAPEVRAYETAQDFLAVLETKRLSPEFTRAWEHFMAEFGMRCPGEIDPATPRPKEQPGLFFEQLKNMSRSTQEQSRSVDFFAEARAKREAAYQALYGTALKSSKKKARNLEKYYKTWEMFGGYRETPKHYVIQVVDIFRHLVLRIAQGFVESCRLDHPEQIFDLTIDDIDRAQADPTVDLRALAQERSLLINRMRKSHLVARIIDSRGKIFYPPHQATGDGSLKGVPISPGTVQGRVKVFQYAIEKQLLPGEILVARATDPGWTPLFINAGGIILEIGGALQHGAVAAREYGIPCVSGLDGATTLLKDGQWVEVDGSNGTVRIIEREISPESGEPIISR
jgi:rifampicin phosphotransferase